MQLEWEVSKLNKVLFSPVGMTDPIRCNRDGPMLHIIRHYKPEKVYLFFTSETEDLEKTDRRYTLSITESGFDCQVQTIFSSIGDPSDFDAFIKVFPETLRGIAEENPGAQLLINISSGTSQMISALCLEIASNRYNLLPIQVKTPERRSNIVRQTGDFNLEGEVKNLLDKDTFHYPSRCEIPGMKNFRKALLCSQVETLIKTYDYHAALQIIEPYSALFENFELTTTLLKHLWHRLSLQSDMAEKTAVESGIDFEFYPCKNKDAEDIIEYFQTMKIKQKRGELSDFIMRITPFATETAKVFLGRFIDWENLTVMENGVPSFSRKLIKDYSIELFNLVNREYKGGLRDTHFVNLSIFASIIRALPDIALPEKQALYNNRYHQVKKLLGMLNNLETVIRNKTAHEMRLVTEDTLKSKTGRKSSQILKDLEILLSVVFPDDYIRDFLIYDRINDLIIENLR